MTIIGGIRMDGARRTVTLTRDFSAAPADVWDAIVNPVRAARWIGRIERDGDRYTLKMPEPDDLSVTGEILYCVQSERIGVTWAYGTEPETLLEVELSATESGTRMTLKHRRMPAVLAAGYGAGWEDFLTDLAVLLRGQGDGAGDRASDDAGVAGGGEPGFDFDASYREYREVEAALVPAELVREGDRTGVRLRRLLDAPPERVWDAITTPEGLAGWLWPVVSWPDDPVRQRRLELGDAFALGDPNVSEQAQRSRVLDLEPQRSITISWGAHDTSVRLAIEAADGGTMLTLDQSPAADQFGAGRMRSGPDYAAGWHALVDGLSLALAGQSVPTPEGLWDAAYAVYSRS